ncbi:MAG: hypothetical protein NVS1B11_24800 [Terriglobales bacterium]
MKPLFGSLQTAKYSEAISQEQSLQFWVRIAFLCIAAVFGLIQAWDGRNSMNADGIAYLDLADAHLRGGWSMLVNGHWSPFYPWLLSIALRILKPSPYWEFPVINLLNFVIYFFALFSFDFLLKEVIADQQQRSVSGELRLALPPWALMSVGYLLFIWSSLALVTMSRKSPDMLMAIFVYLATAIVIRIRDARANWLSYLFLGVVLGLGYLSKAPMFPLAFVFLAIPLCVSNDLTRTVPRVLLALSIFLLISGPYISTLSVVKGRVTFGDSAKLNYLWYINGAGPVWYLQELGTARGQFQHPPRRIFDFPPVYSFAGAVGGTQPSWYDPSYWIEGALPHFDLRKQLSAVARNARDYSAILFVDGGCFLAVFLALFFLAGFKESLRGIMDEWPMWAPALAGLGMYLLVLTERRYVAVFLAIFWLSLFSGLRISVATEFRKIARSATLALLVAAGAPLAFSAAHDLHEGLGRRPHPAWEVAETLRRKGVKPGDSVGRIGGTFGADWARLLRVRVIAEIPRDKAPDFWSAGPKLQAQVLESFSKTGATAIVAQQIPPFEVFAPTLGWERIGNGNFYVFLLPGDARVSRLQD